MARTHAKLCDRRVLINRKNVMSKSTIVLGNDRSREALLTLMLTKISMINRVIKSESGSHDEAKKIKKVLTAAIRYKKFLSHKDSTVTITIDDLDAINAVIDFVL